MKAAVICHGSIWDFEFHRRLLKDCDIIICADGGAYHVKKMGMQPHVIIGDFDSCTREFAQSFSGAKIIEYPSEKDDTDAQLAVEYALSNGADYIMLLGATGTRIDHTIANIGLLLCIADKGVVGELINEYNRATIIKDRALVKGKGSLVSLIPYGGDVRGVTLKGFKYPLYDFTLEMGSSRGISNQLVDDIGEISITSGWLLVVLSRD
ncbi:MAG: thiamine diphosphokinase [Clostridia bacterium]|jgi:thiamine pyrophosphokinase